MFRPYMVRRRALTLLEMIISVGLLVVLLSMMFWFYNSALAQRAAGATSSRDIHLARVILEQMAREIRQSVSSMPNYGPGVYGYHSREAYTDIIEINALYIPDKTLTQRRTIRDDQPPGQFNLEQVKYYMAWDDENLDENGDPRPLGLVRRVTRTYGRQIVLLEGEEDEMVEATEDAQLAFKQELYAPEIKYLEFRYFDGANWWREWKLAQSNSLPQIVRITIGFVPEIPESEEFELIEEDFLKDEDELDPLPDDRYTMFVRLAQADVLFRSRISREVSALSESEGGY